WLRVELLRESNLLKVFGQGLSSIIGQTGMYRDISQGGRERCHCQALLSSFMTNIEIITSHALYSLRVWSLQVVCAFRCLKSFHDLVYVPSIRCKYLNTHAECRSHICLNIKPLLTGLLNIIKKISRCLEVYRQIQQRRAIGAARFFVRKLYARYRKSTLGWYCTRIGQEWNIKLDRP